jgi:anti-sigma regulatory factor (Ser/Thr protein kinase)/CheY-like chemotaxis protein
MPRVLLVGRADAVRPSLERAPLPPDTEVETCPGNIEAMHRLRARAYDVVVTQPSTSVQDSLPVAHELQEARPGVRVVVLASSAAPAEIIEALRAQVYACFTQPFDYPEIASIVVQALRETNWRHSIEVVSGKPNWMTLRVSCGLLTADRLVRFMTEYRSDMPEAERDLLMTAFREMLMNAMEHGAGFDPEKVIEVSAARTGRAIVYHFRDPGDGFDRGILPEAPLSSHDDLMAHADAREAAGKRPGGFGMLIVKQIVDEVVYNERGNEVLLIKYLDR